MAQIDSSPSFSELKAAYVASGNTSASGNTQLRDGSTTSAIILSYFRNAGFTSGNPVPSSGSISIDDDFKNRTFAGSNHIFDFYYFANGSSFNLSQTMAPTASKGTLKVYLVGSKSADVLGVDADYDSSTNTFGVSDNSEHILYTLTEIDSQSDLPLIGQKQSAQNSDWTHVEANLSQISDIEDYKWAHILIAYKSAATGGTTFRQDTEIDNPRIIFSDSSTVDIGTSGGSWEQMTDIGSNGSSLATTTAHTSTDEKYYHNHTGIKNIQDSNNIGRNGATWTEITGLAGSTASLNNDGRWGKRTETGSNFSSTQTGSLVDSDGGTGDILYYESSGNSSSRSGSQWYWWLRNKNPFNFNLKSYASKSIFSYMTYRHSSTSKMGYAHVIMYFEDGGSSATPPQGSFVLLASQLNTGEQTSAGQDWHVFKHQLYQYPGRLVRFYFCYIRGTLWNSDQFYDEINLTHCYQEDGTYVNQLYFGTTSTMERLAEIGGNIKAFFISSSLAAGVLSGASNLVSEVAAGELQWASITTGTSVAKGWNLDSGGTPSGTNQTGTNQDARGSTTGQYFYFEASAPNYLGASGHPTGTTTNPVASYWMRTATRFRLHG
jgi:hypothetical protein